MEPNPLEDVESVTMIGASSILCTIWWLLTFFLYPRGSNQTWLIPIAEVFNGTFTIFKAAYICTWVLYFFGSVIEFFAWATYVTEVTDGDFFLLWVTWVSTLFNGALYLVPPVVATIAIGFEEGFTPASYPAFIIMDVLGMVMWVYNGMIHLLYKGRLEKYIKGNMVTDEPEQNLTNDEEPGKGEWF